MLERDRDLCTLRPRLLPRCRRCDDIDDVFVTPEGILGASYFRIAFERIRADSEGFAEGFQVLEWWALEGLNL